MFGSLAAGRHDPDRRARGDPGPRTGWARSSASEGDHLLGLGAAGAAPAGRRSSPEHAPGQPAAAGLPERRLDPGEAARPGALDLPGARTSSAWAARPRRRSGRTSTTSATVDPGWVSIPYGKPIQNARYYVLDPSRNPCPIGVPGDLYIGGECLADGYVQRPGADATEVRARPVRRGRRRADVPDRRPRALLRGRQHRVPRPARLPGQGPRLPHRAGRDRGGARRAPGRRRLHRDGARRRRRRALPGGLRGRAPTETGPAGRRCAPTSRSACPSSWCRSTSSASSGCR